MKVFVVALLLFAQEVSAALNEITIKDTAGVTRNVTQADQPGPVTFSLTNAAGMPADGVEVSLSNELTGDVLHAVSANGSVVFENVAPGTWVVSTNAADITFTSIMVGVGTGMAAAGGGAALAGPLAIIAGGGAAVTGASVAISKAADDDDDDELSPSS